MEAVSISLTCDDTTDVCPGTELTCTCSVSNTELVWKLPGSETITFDEKAGVGSNETTINGIFAIITDNTGSGGKKSMLIYTATESLVNDSNTIECVTVVGIMSMSKAIIITGTFAG